jgi:hypothetical protein
MKSRYTDVVIGTIANELASDAFRSADEKTMIDTINRATNWVKNEAVTEDIFKEDVVREILWLSEDYPKDDSLKLDATKIAECRAFVDKHLDDYVKGIFVDYLVDELKEDEKLDQNIVERAYQSYLYNDISNVFMDDDVNSLIQSAKFDLALDEKSKGAKMTSVQPKDKNLEMNGL